MAWRDRVRRRAAAPDSADRPRRTERSGAGGDDPSGEGPDRSVPGDPGASVPDAPGPSVPGDWDGGWRRTPPPELTVSRAALGVSDGLAFRAGLAAWQNPSFDAGLGHALLPTAPTGLVRGVTRPAAPQPTLTGGGPLLLRALRPEGADGPRDDGTPDAPTSQGARGMRPGARPSGTAPLSGSVSPGSVSPGSVSSSPESSTALPSRGGSGARPGANSTAGKGSSDDAPRPRGITSADSPAALSPPRPPVQRAAEPDTGPVVTPADTGRPSAAPETALVRRVSVVPGAAADGGVARPTSPTLPGVPHPNSGPASRSSAGSGARTPSGPTVQRTTTGMTGPQSAREGGRPEAPRTSGAEVSPPAVRLRPVGPSMTVARHPAGPVRRVPALRPAATPAPPDHSTTPEASGPASTTTAQRAAPRPGSRAPLGAPLSELPSTAAPLAEGNPAPPPAPGPALPVVQRHADGTVGTPRPYDSAQGTAHDATDGPAAPADAPRRAPGRAGARVRGGLGAPLPALPPSADLPGSAASGARASRPAPDPAAQRAPARQDRRSTAAPAAATTDHDRTPTEAVPRTAPLAPGESGADAPLLGAADVQRRLADHSYTGGTTEPGGPAGHGNGPATPMVTPSPAAAPQRPAAPEGALGTAGSAGNATPLVTPSPAVAPHSPAGPAGPAGNARRPGTTSGGPGPGRQRPQGPAAPGPANPTPVVVARAIAQGAGGARPSGAAGPPPLTGTRSSVTHSAPAAPRTLSLLAARPLPLNTRAPEGVAPPAASRSGARPVVAARWPGAPAAAQGDSAPPARPTPGRSAATPATPQVQRAATAHPGPGNSGVRRASSAGSVPASSVPASSVPASVQRVPVVRPAPPHGETPPPHGDTPGTVVAPAAAVPARSLPVTAPPAPPLTDRPSVPSAQAPVGSVPVVRPRTVAPGRGTAATPVQRDISVAGDLAVPKDAPAKDAPAKKAPANEVPARGRPRSASASTTSASATAGKGAARRAETPQDPGLDLDDLARRLLDPVARLLRTELRRGRERTGRPYDGRR
ncbi:hypothetical protein ABT063_31295 [Streptomyces sp. NPDC002838]|uniref:hypothetical protein n=1 Tax=Streptomyces sp. NPDC002838 TaxID=3154436 RepID=UPI00332C49F3